jgi:DNA polymerase
VPAEDAVEVAWLTYYASIFNPARLKVAMMQSEMPKKYWRNLPEAELIAPLIRRAQPAEQNMIERAATTPSVRHTRQAARQPVESDAADEPTSLVEAKIAATACTRCPLYEHATQTVFGEGAPDAAIMFVGEQPGDQEDLAGRPFVGPAGQVFDAALKVAGIDRGTTYVTNSVKHFKFEPRGKRRIHQKPNAGEIRACRFWVDLEREFIKPKVIVAMGATAISSLLGRSMPVNALRGKATLLDDGTPMWVTVHPSYLLRLPDRELAAIEHRRFEDDLRGVRDYLKAMAPAAAPARRA